MRIFTTLDKLNNWHYLNFKNINRYLASFPYRQNGQVYAICNYCHNPIKIIQRSSKDNEQNGLSLYASHVKTKKLDGFSPVNEDRLKHCLLSKKAQIMAFSPLSTPSFQIDDINQNNLRKDLTFYCGIFFSHQLTRSMISNHRNVVQFRDADYYNLPFALLVATKEINLNYRKVASPHLSKAIETNSQYFSISSEKQLLQKERFEAANLTMSFGNQKVGDSNLPSLEITVTESLGDISNTICDFRIFAKMFTNLLERKD